MLSQALLNAVQIQDTEWDLFRQHAPWMKGEAHQMELTLTKLLSLGYRLAGTPRIGIIAEHLAATIVVFVHPVNWRNICAMAGQGLKGTNLLMPNGDEVEARETVSPEKLHAMVIAMSQLPDTVYRVVPEEGDANATQETEQAHI